MQQDTSVEWNGVVRWKVNFQYVQAVYGRGRCQAATAAQGTLPQNHSRSKSQDIVQLWEVKVRSR
jgi:hypothetical protein